MSPRKRILEQLKSAGPVSAAQLGEALGITKMAALQHLHSLEEQAVVQRQANSGPRGRPTFLWSLTPAANKFFPDAHADLAVSLIACLEESLGAAALDKLIAVRSRHQIEKYRREMAPAGSLHGKLEALAAVRSQEGYMATVEKLEDRQSYLLVEKHCPICVAAKACTGLCREELSVFREVLGDNIKVERTEHIVMGASRCAYAIRPRNRHGQPAGSSK
jgi:predicted ArsR family transcriptional regulator